MRNIRNSSLIVYSIMFLFLLIGCNSANQTETKEVDSSKTQDHVSGDAFETKVLRYSGTAGQVSFWELAEDLGYLEPLKLEWTGNSTSGPENIQATVTGNIDFGGAFNGAIVKLVEAGAPITALIGYYGSDDQTWNGYYVLDDSPIKGAKDLIGKQIGVNTLGAHHEFAIVEYLRREGLTKEEVNEVSLVVIPPANGEQSLRSGQLDATTLGGVIKEKALERGGIHPLFKDTDLFGSFTAGSLVFRDDFIKNNPNTVAKFVEGMAKAIEWARETPVEDVRERMKSIIEKRSRNEDTELVQYWKSVGIEGQGGLILESEFQVWIEWLEEDGFLDPGKLSVEDIYTNEFNPYNN
ncbi:ABC transporter substrate-binding protein [Halalkalibacter alkalisediminis]|uniref:ABC transporter substrate-binding protein n=1 Tax=Halalkalibacter alkalisediminis TaxID=935616 RepID=A0ABV6NDS3_9BACI|nr:ABC transporter substrate-binding protein [Halalkalibacter alkalisediminis]